MTLASITGVHISSTSKYFPLGSLHRILWIHEEDDIAVLIRIDITPLLRPCIATATELRYWIDNKHLLPHPVKADPQHRLSDVTLNKRFPAKILTLDPETGEEQYMSAPVQYRKKWLAVIDEITPHLESIWRKLNSLNAVIGPIADKHDVAKNETYQVLYRFLAAGSARLSVISNRLRCGGKGKSRLGKGFNLGRLKTENKLKDLPNDNFPLDPTWIEKIQDTHEETIKRGVSGNEAFSTFMNLHCTTSCQFIDGELKVEYLPENQMPSKSQFLDHGPGDDPAEMIWRKQLVDKEFEKNFKGLYGGADPKTFRTGLLADVDASSNDRYLVSVFNPAIAVGTARFIPVVDESIGYIFGFYVGWRVNGEAAKLSILNAASDKFQFCARYGIALAPGEWYSCLHAAYRADKGEFNAKNPRAALGSLNRSIEFVATGHPELRGGGEKTHDRMHDHNADGSTHGKFRTRGEKDPAKSANQNIFQYTRELIRRVLWLNNFAPADHLLDSEMRRNGVEGTRKAILEYSMRNHYHHQILYDEDELMLSLCPEVPAMVTESGVYPLVKRYGEYGDDLLLNELRYLGPYIKANRWLEIARYKKRWQISILMNPNDPRKVGYQDPDAGLQIFHLATEDALLGRIVTVNDLVVSRTAEVGPKRSKEHQADLARAETQLVNDAEREIDAKSKKKAQETTKTTHQSGRTGAGRRQNQKDEVATAGQSPIPIITPTAPSSPTANHPQAPSPTNETPVASHEDDATSKLIDSWLEDNPE